MPEPVYTQPSLFGGPVTKPKTLSFDLETQNSFDDVGGKNNIGALKMSVGITMDLDTDEFQVYTEEQVGSLIDALLAARRVVGFHVRRFDFRVLAPYTSRDLSKIACFDLLESLESILGHRVKLDNVAGATLGAKKSGHGLEAIEWFRSGQMDKLISYCKDDVRLTADVYRFGQKNGHVMIDDWGKPKKVPVKW
ncbi:MAG: ribonuclease H-like domain-containing protein [Planctomycetes bacterium]|nr:ribonuclease H-like domain-containing protein [Planctomycetota bacterium]